MERGGNFVAPGQQRYLRACMVCSIVMTQTVRLLFFSSSPLFCSYRGLADTPNQRFRQEGCPNCEEYLHLKGDTEAIESCTSQVYEGLITLANPAKSWVAKWQRLDTYVQGVYAIKVSGQLPEEVRTAIEEEYRITYIP
jgi:transcription elongation factor SPT4